MKKNKKKVCKLASELIKTMRSHRCKNKSWKSDDDPILLDIGYKCSGCGLQVIVNVVDLKKDRDSMRLFWKALKTQTGRIKLGEAFSKDTGILPHFLQGDDVND